MPHKLTLEQVGVIKEKFGKLTSGENPLSKRQACQLLGRDFGVTREAINYWTSPKIRERAIQSATERSKRPDIIAKERNYRRDTYYANEEIRQRKRFYAKLRRSHLAKAILPKVFEQSGKELLDFQELTDLIRKETDIGFQQETLKSLLTEKFTGSARSPPILEDPKRIGKYYVNLNFYKTF